MTRTWPEQACPDNDNAVSEDDLQAYVDGQLEGRRRAAIESYLAARPAEAARLAAYRAQNIGLHALFDSPPGARRSEGTVPPRLASLAAALDSRLAVGEARSSGGRSRRLRSLAASIALLVGAGVAGWVAAEQVSPPSNLLVAFTEQAAQAPLQTASLGPSPAISGDTQVSAWLASQPGNVPATIPDLEKLGFHLTGEDLLPTGDGAPAAQLHYRDDSGQRVTLTMRAGGEAGQTRFTFARDGQGSRFVWQDEHMAYSLVGGMAQEKLLKIAEAVSRSLQKTAPAQPQQETAQAPVPADAAVRSSDGAAPASPLDPTSPEAKPAPQIEKIPLMPVPLPDSGTPKET